MGSRARNNSLQTAPLMSTPSTGDDDVVNVPSTSRTGGSLEGLPAVDASGEAGISPAIVLLITQTVQAALAAERADNPPSSLASTPPIPSVSSPSVPSTATSACSGGVPPLLSSSTHAFLTTGAGVAGPSHPGRPIQSMYPVVPSFVSTFANPLMSAFSSGSAYNLLTGATRLVQKDPEPQLLLDGRLVLTSQPKKQRRRIEDIASWMEAFAIFSLILVSSFPHRWKDLMQYQLLILQTYRHFSGRVWLAYDQAFREHAAATRLTDWSSMNVQLFNFHAAGSSVRGSSLPSSNESPKPPGSSSSTILCKSWNKGHCPVLILPLCTSVRCFVQALIGLRHALTSLPKTVGTVRNVAVVPQALLGQGLKLRLAAVDLPPGF